MATTRTAERLKRKLRIRAQLKNKAGLPRVSVYRSNKGLFAQVIDDSQMKTLYSVRSEGQVNVAESEKLGKKLGADIIKGKEFTKVMFDRNGYSYKGRVKAFAEGLRAAGVEF